MTYKNRVKNNMSAPLKSERRIHASGLLRRKSRQSDELLRNPKGNIKHPEGRLVFWSQIIANGSQFLMLCLVAWGYIYTVLPAMQKEQLAEELAKLELEKATWDENIASVSRQLQQKEKELKNLKKTKATLLSDIRTLTDERDGLGHRLDAIQKEYNHAELELLKSKQSIDKATKDLLAKYKQDLLSINKIPDSLLTIYDNAITGGPFSNNNIIHLSRKLEKEYPKPIESAQRTLSSIGKSITHSSGADKLAKKRLFDEYKSGIYKMHYLLMCPTPNYDAWVAAFIQFNDVVNPLSKLCVERELDHLAHDKKWSKDTIDAMKKTDFWIHQESAYRNDCKLMLDFELKRTFNNEWDKIKEPCEQRLMKVNDVILNNDFSIALKPFLDMSAPTREFIISKLEDTLNEK